MNNEIEKLIKTNQIRLHQYAKSLCKDNFLADDIIQETLIICYQKYDSLKDKSKFLPWAKSVAKNLYLRNQQSQRETESLDESYHVDEQFYDQVETLYQKQKHQLLLALFSKLPPTQRELAIEYYIKGIPRQDICKTYKITEPVFDSRLLRMRNKIKRYLKKRHSDKQEIAFINKFNELLKGDYSMDEFRVEISKSLVPDLISGEQNIISFIKNQRQRFKDDYGVKIPKVHIIDNEYLKGAEYIILKQEKRIQEGVIEGPDKLMAMNDTITQTIFH
jgi:RNA polymerase sigma-70 factor (ECF subfamily)